jgi:hypothetical protein
MTASMCSARWRERARAICGALAIVMALASLPAVGVVNVRVEVAPCFTLNICHPLQSAFPASDNVPLARPAIAASEMTMTTFPAPPPCAKPLAPQFLPQPVPPPPKLSA